MALSRLAALYIINHTLKLVIVVCNATDDNDTVNRIRKIEYPTNEREQIEHNCDNKLDHSNEKHVRIETIFVKTGSQNCAEGI